MINKQQRLIKFDGGRRLPNDDLRAIQRQLDNLALLFAGWGPFLLRGCEVTENPDDNSLSDIAAGIVYLNDRLIYVPGFTAVDLSTGKYLHEINSTTLAPRQYVLTGNTEDGLEEYQVDLVNSEPSGEESIEFREEGPVRTRDSHLNLKQAVEDIATIFDNLTDKADKGGPAGTIIAGTHFSFLNDCTSGSPFGLRVYKDDFDTVHLRGSVQLGGSANPEAFQLPSNHNGEDFTPSTYFPFRFPVVNKSTPSDNPYCIINGDGVIEIYASSNEDEIDLSVVSFNASV